MAIHTISSMGVNARSGLYLISTALKKEKRTFLSYVSMPSRAYTSFLRWHRPSQIGKATNCVNALSGLYLISTYREQASTKLSNSRVNALSSLYLISTVPLQKPRFYAVYRACFCRYLSEYSDNSCFSCMLTFWTYLMRCTYPWHWIKYSTNYNRCHPIFSLSW